MTRQAITLGDKEFKTKKAAVAYFQSLLFGLAPGKYLVGDDFIAVFESVKRRDDADEIIGCGIEEIIIEAGLGKERHFKGHRIDGSVVEFGYHRSLGQIKSKKQMVSIVFRDAINRETAGDHAFCMGKPKGFQVHHVIPFHDIANNFIEAYDIDVDDVKLEQDPETRKYCMLDNKLRRKLLEYCRQVAVLRLLCYEDHKVETAKREWVH